MILKVIQQIFCEILIGGRKNVNSDVFFSVTNIRKKFQNDSSEFKGLLHEMVSQKPFISQEICHISLNGERSICTVSDYIKKTLSIVYIRNKICQRCSKLKTPFELVSDKLIISLEGLPTYNSSRQIDHPKCTILTKGHCCFGYHITELFQGIIVRRFYM